MPKLRIELFENGKPSATINVPTWMIGDAASLLPKAASTRLQGRIDMNEIEKLLKNPGSAGQLIEIEDHEGGDRVVISIVGDR